MKFFNSNRWAKVTFFLFGTGSIIWFLIRVIPKPTRATYPCMQASYPLMSAFVAYLIAMVGSLFLFKKQLAKYALVLAFVVAAFFSFTNSGLSTSAIELNPISYYTNQANKPMGVAQGVFPGRVVWVHNPDATNASMKNTSGDYWYMDKNCNQTIVDSMMVSGIRRMGGRSNVKEAWDEIFKYFNQTHKRGNIGYQKGEKIAIKINLTNSCCNGGTATSLMDASPQMVLSILKQLVNVVGVAQTDIWMGDPYRIFRNEYYTKCVAVFPNVHYVDGTGNVGGRTGREVTKPSATQVLKFSDGQNTASLPQHYLDATYLINMPCLKSHNEGGITLAAKNHQGSILSNISANGNTPSSQSAYYMHYALPVPTDGVQSTNEYRHLVDYMGHKDLGGKTLLYIMDALWAGKSWNGLVEKWKIEPFNNDYPSSIFMSQDAVAFESVGFDFLLAEYASKVADEQYPYMVGLDDYMKQAADPKNWPAGITYDPEDDGTPIGSLGVYEHWNGVATKQYSRNLGTGTGIELKAYTAAAVDNYVSENVNSAVKNPKSINYKIYPTSFLSNLNIESGTIEPIQMNVFNLQGQLLYQKTFTGTTNWDGIGANGQLLKMGNYVLQLKDKRTNEIIVNCKIIKQ
ncbi:MAG: DUF362 domain-containing protein [Paludibacter sp.]